MPKTKTPTAREQVRAVAALSEEEFAQQALARLDAISETVRVARDALDTALKAQAELRKELQLREINARLRREAEAAKASEATT